MSLPLIDKRIRYVGASYLRKFNADALRNLGDTVYVIQCPKPTQVLIGYAAFMRMQDEIERLERLRERGGSQ